MFLSGLLVAFSLLFLGCSDDESAEPEPQQQAETSTTETQQTVQQQEQARQTQERDTQQESGVVVNEETQQQQIETQEAEQGDSERVQQEQAQQTRQAQQTAEAEAQEQQGQAAEVETKVVVGGDRPATLLLPKAISRSEPRLLILLLHGYGSYALQADQYFRFSSWVDQNGFGLLIPDGTKDRNGAQFWNGTGECCDIFGAETDDVGYLKALIEEAREHALFDQVFAVGHSNGGFMAYRLACEEVPGLEGIVSLAGGAHSSADECRVPRPLSVLQIHGTEDDLVLYETGPLPVHPDPDRKPVPGAWASVTRWAERAGCDLDVVVELDPIDADSAVEGDETTVKRYSQGCVNAAVMELWTIEGGGHVPIVWETDFTPAILDWIGERYSQGREAALQVQERVIGGERSARLQFPPGTEDEAIPLVLSLHGYGGEPAAHDAYFGLSERILEYGFALISPQGSTDSRGNAFWNATDACCNFDGSQIDDYDWLSALVAEVREIVTVSGVHVVGYSNGGFMAYRVACDGLDGLVSVVSLAGSSFGDPERCEGTSPVSLLQIHGSADLDIPYSGTLEYDGGYPGATELTQRWAQRAGCDAEAVESLPNIDLEVTIDGAETSVQRFTEGCADGATIELWTIEGADHFPQFDDDWPDHLLNWLLEETRGS